MLVTELTVETMPNNVTFILHEYSTMLITYKFVRPPRWPYDMRPSACAEKYIRDAGP